MALGLSPADACQTPGCGHARNRHKRGGSSCRMLQCKCMIYIPKIETRGDTRERRERRKTD